MSVAAILESIRQEAETAENPGTAALFLARYYGFHPRVTRMIELVVGQQEGQKACHNACVMLLTNEEGNMYSAFWQSMANLYLGQMMLEGTGRTRDEYFSSADACLWRVAVDRYGKDLAYVQRRMKVVRLDDVPATENHWAQHIVLVDEMVEAGDFDAPRAVQRLLESTHPGDAYVEPGPQTLNFLQLCFGRINGPNCYYSKVQMAVLKEYVKKKFGV